MARRFHLGIQLGVALSAGLLVSACGNKATGQTVAVVNGEEITMGELNAALATANVPPTADKEAARAQILQNLVNRRLLAQQARQQGVDKSPDFISRQRQLTEQLLIGLNAERQSNTVQLPDQRAIDSFIAAHPAMFGQREVWSLQQVQFPAPTSQDAVNRLKGAHTLDQLTAALTALQIPFQRGEAKLDTAVLPADVLRQINALPATEPFIVPQGQRMVASVIVGRQSSPTPPEQSRQLALEAIRRQSAETRLQESVKQLRSTAKIEYQPGFAPKSGAAAAGKAAS